MSGSLTIRNNTTQLAIAGSSPTVTVAVAVPGPAGEGAGGTVTSVAVAVPTGLEVSGSPIATAGTITLSYSTGYALPTIAAVAQGVTAYGYGNHASAGYLTSSAAALAYQPLAAVLTGTTASFTTADETKLDHITVTQAVDLDAIETRVNALDAAVVLKGVWDASAGTFPGSGAAQAGDSWIVSVGGTVDSVAFAVGDRAIAITDNASTGTFAANWFKADYTDHVLSVCGRTGAVTIASTDITDSTTAGRTLLTAADAAAQRTALALVPGTDVQAYDANTHKPIHSIIVAIGDETTAATTGTAKVTFRMPYAMTLTEIPRASCTTAPTGAAAQIDINEAGSSILSTKLTIDVSEKTSTTAATAAVLSDSSLADDAEITIDMDVVGSTIAGAGYKVALIGRRT